MSTIEEHPQTENSSPLRIVRPPAAEDPFCVVWKGAGLPSSPLCEGGRSALTEAVRLLPFLDNVAGKGNPLTPSIERGLIHRLDTDTSGLILIASTQESYGSLVAAQKCGLFKKTYCAFFERIPNNAALLGGFPPVHAAVSLAQAAQGGRFPLPDIPCSLSSRFRPYGEGRKAVRPVTEESGTAAKKNSTRCVYTTVIEHNEGSALTLSITAGFRHQIRCHLSWLGLPIIGDALYNSHKTDTSLMFECVSLTFPHPLTGRTVSVEL